MKKLNKLVAILVAMAMVLSLSIVAAFADDPEPEVPTGTIDEAYLVKYLKIDEGVTIPNATFTFSFEGIETATVKAADYAGTGTPADVTINARDMTPSASAKDGGALVGTIPFTEKGEDPNTIAGIFDEVVFPHNGEYLYLVKEKSISPATNFSANTEYYQVRVYVAENGSKTVTAEEVTVTPGATEDDDDVITPVNNGKKDVTDTDPSQIDENDDDTDGDEKDLTDAEVIADAEGFTFTNVYTDPTDNPIDPANGQYGAFGVTKEVTGAYGDKTVKFPFQIAITTPTGYENGQKAITAYITTLDKHDLTGAEETTITIGDTSGFALKNNEVLIIPNLPDGAQVTVTELLGDTTKAGHINTRAEYLPTAVANDAKAENVEAVVTTTGGQAENKGNNLAAAQVTYNDADVGQDKADYTNENKYDPGTTGILMSNLPYIALALVAIGGLVAYVVVRRRQDDEA